MPNTITVYNTFVAGTKARATEVNQNFDNYRGHLVPIEEDTAAASDGTHNLGAPDHEWKSLYLSENPYVSGVQMQVVPTSAIVPYSGSSVPSGFLFCDGSAISRTTYANLFALIGERYGVGDLSTTFNIPDCRGRVLRSCNAGSGRDPDYLSRTSSLEAFTATGEITAGTTTFSSVASTFINRMAVGMRCYGTENSTATTGHVYNFSTTIASIPAAFINYVHEGAIVYGNQLPTTTVTSVNTAGASIVVATPTIAAGVTTTSSLTFLLNNLPTTTIASINTATSTIVFNGTCMVSTISADITFDFGCDLPGSTQEDAFQSFAVGCDYNRLTKRQYWGFMNDDGYYNSQAVAANYGAIAFSWNPTDTSSYLANFMKPITDKVNGDPRLSSETRSKNIYTYHLIKY